MSNNLEQDLIYALLALDSYNRGYGSGISDLDDTVNSAHLGDWVVYDTKGDSLAQSAGFYAIAYRNTQTQEVVISYRGTDVSGRNGRSVWT